MARRGILAELVHQAQLAARENERRAREAERARNAMIRAEERARKADERVAAQLARADVASQKQLAKKAREAHIAAREAEVESRNLELTQIHEEIDSLLSATLEVDDYVDLTALHTVAEHPPFDRADLEVPIPAPAPIRVPPEPTYVPPEAPQGLRGLFGGKKHEIAVTKAAAAHETAVAEWRAELARAEAARQAAACRHAEAEAQRVAALDAERGRYARECVEREALVAERNQALDRLISDLAYGAVDAVQEYVAIVLANSVYPDHFPVEHDFKFDPSNAELQLKTRIPAPGEVPSVAAYKYIKLSDEIRATALSQKACRERYANAVLQVALRSLHEVFEADRRGLIKTISLQVGTQTINPATGLEDYIPFVAVGAERDSFLELNLSSVVPAATLKLLGAAVSKNPYGLIAVSPSGIRRS